VGLRVGLDMVTKTNYSCPCQESNPGRPARSLVTILTDTSIRFPAVNIYRTYIALCIKPYMVSWHEQDREDGRKVEARGIKS